MHFCFFNIRHLNGGGILVINYECYNKAEHNQQTDDSLTPTTAPQLLHLCSTSLQELRQRQHEPVQSMGISMKHQNFEE